MPPTPAPPPGQLQEEIVQPKTLYAFDEESGTWVPVEPERTQDATPDLNPTSNPIINPTNPASDTTTTSTNLTAFTLITYNIDAMNYHVHERLNTLLSFLHTHTIAPLLAATTPPIPTIILLQELSNDALPTLLAHPVVREGFCVTDVDTEDWEASYGTITLVPRGWAVSGRVRGVWRTPFVGSRMGRSALYVDVDLDVGGQREGETNGGGGGQKKLLRIANVHLESLRGRSDALRIEQLTCVSRRLHEPGIYAGVVAGDMNPIGPYDDDAPASLGLTDAWLACQEMSVAGTYNGQSKSTDEWEGITWGQQPPSQFPERRMDKILLVGKVLPREVEVVGKGLVAEGIQLDDIDEEIKEDLEGMEEDEVWVSDHYGVVARIDVV